jgi:hypothetical protein
MALPMEVTVGRGTPVHIHVSRKHKSNAQALSESLSRETGRGGSSSARTYGAHSSGSSDVGRGRGCDCHSARTQRCCECHRSEPVDVYARCDAEGNRRPCCASSAHSLTQHSACHPLIPPVLPGRWTIWTTRSGRCGRRKPACVRTNTTSPTS